MVLGKGFEGPESPKHKTKNNRLLLDQLKKGGASARKRQRQRQAANMKVNEFIDSL